MGFIGNIVVGITTAYCFLLGGTSITGGSSILGIPYSPIFLTKPSFIRVIFPAVLAFLMNIGREITKGIDDIEGDKKQNIKTLAVNLGPGRARYFAITFFVATIVFSIFPFLLGYFTIIYLLIAVFGIDTILSYSVYSLYKDYSPENAHTIKKLIMFAFYLGFLAFLFGIPLS
jgi:geranylgeranylglycerol-phosphate geranylgeranyltransferase